jgi:hypothetical protein
MHWIGGMVILLLDDRELHALPHSAILKIDSEISDFLTDGGMTLLFYSLRDSSPYYFTFNTLIDCHVFVVQ